jgi:lipopolysaccharide/colanic/teichoic acid biosynthesis glycosyltransferase
VNFASAQRIIPATRQSVSDSYWRELLGGLAWAVLLPWLARYWLSSKPPLWSGMQNVVYGSTAAIVFGHYFFKRLVSFPGARATSYILPTFLASYGAILSLFFFVRLDYSRVDFAYSFVACLLWYYACHFLVNRKRVRTFAVVPVGKTCELRNVRGVEWRSLPSHDMEFPHSDGLVADFRADLSDEWERYIADRAIAGVPVFHVKQIQESVTGRVDIEHLSENNFGSLIPGLAYIKIKQWIDVAMAGLAAILLAPIFLIVAIVIKLDTPGPAFFRQRRMGYRGHAFTVLKFRTMTHRPRPYPADDLRFHAITRDGDDRITRVGRFLRRTRIDELPQILNILRGEMSWIGPRPEAAVLSEWYEQEIPFYRYRHIVRPGVSGWAQVNQGHVANVTEVHSKLQYDFYYVKYFSPWLDILIMFRTIRTMLTGFGSR